MISDEDLRCQWCMLCVGSIDPVEGFSTTETCGYHFAVWDLFRVLDVRGMTNEQSQLLVLIRKIRSEHEKWKVKTADKALDMVRVSSTTTWDERNVGMTSCGGLGGIPRSVAPREQVPERPDGYDGWLPSKDKH